MKVLLSLHDVTPVHLDRLERAEQLLRRLDVDQVAYLFVPRFHGAPAVAKDDAFREWCGRPRPFRIRWFLHGYYHSDSIAPATHPPSTSMRLKERVLTDGEGEFGRLRGQQLRDRLDDGMRAFADCFGSRPNGFVAPAWLFTEELPAALRERSFVVTEDHTSLYDLRAGTRRACPVVTWATRTFIRQVGSLLVAPLHLHLSLIRPVIRIALHPHDFDHPLTISNIAGVIRQARRLGTLASYDEVIGSAG